MLVLNGLPSLLCSRTYLLSINKVTHEVVKFIVWIMEKRSCLRTCF
jgi:hypothetical protein